MARSKMKRWRQRMEARNLLVVTVTCSNPACDGRCIPPSYRRQALPAGEVRAARRVNPEHRFRLPHLDP